MTGGRRPDGRGAKGGKAAKGSGKGWSDKESGSKGGSKGSFKGKEAGKGKGSKGSFKDGSSSAAKTVQEIEAEFLVSKRDGAAGERQRRSGGDRQPLEFKGAHCEVKKHSEMGCAVVTMESQTARDAVLKLTMGRTPDPEDGKEKRPEVAIEDVKVQVRSHVDKEKMEIKTDLFIAWGRKVEKASPLPPETIAQAFDDLYREAQTLIGQDTAAATASIKSMLAAMPQTNTPAPPPPPPQPPVQSAVPAAPFMGFPGQVAAARPQFPAQNPMMAQQYAAMMAQQMMQQAAMQQAAQAAMVQQAAAQQAAMQQAAAMQAQQAQQQQQQQQQPQAQMQQAQQQQQQQQQHQQQLGTYSAAGSNGVPPATPPPRQEMRADAPAFNFTPEAATNKPNRPERAKKIFQIMDPATKKPIEAGAQDGSTDFEPPKKPDRKAMAIIDPNSGDTIRALDFAMPKDRQSFTITDPNSGTAIQV